MQQKKTQNYTFRHQHNFSSFLHSLIQTYTPEASRNQFVSICFQHTPAANPVPVIHLHLNDCGAL